MVPGAQTRKLRQRSETPETRDSLPLEPGKVENNSRPDSPPPEQTGRVSDALRLPFRTGMRASMNANHIEGHGDDTFPFWQISPREATARRRSAEKSLISSTWTRVGPWLFFICLWMSSLLALWMSRGLLALFLSGQLFSAGSWLFRSFAKKARPLCFVLTGARQFPEFGSDNSMAGQRPTGPFRSLQ